LIELDEIRRSVDRISDIAETLREEPDIPERAKQAFDEIAALAHKVPETEHPVGLDSEGPFTLGGGSIMDGKEGLG
jgi:hypothetical protein